jgi:nitrate reductase NapE component
MMASMQVQNDAATFLLVVVGIIAIAAVVVAANS